MTGWLWALLLIGLSYWIADLILCAWRLYLSMCIWSAQMAAGSWMVVARSSAGAGDLT
jgi:hypothetical protein